jgi:hypothetical protein
MAFRIKNLGVMAYANSFTLWVYRSATDDLAAITAPGYFYGAYEMLAHGDQIFVVARNGGGLVWVDDTAGTRTTAPVNSALLPSGLIKTEPA